MKKTNGSPDSTPVFDAYAAYYDLLYQDKDYTGEAEYIHQLIQKHYPGAKTVLELGSGTGTHAQLLAEKGYHVHGVERSDVMLDEAREKNLGYMHQSPVFTQGDIRDIRLNKKFDVVISLFHVLSYMTTNADLNAALLTAREHVHDSGGFIFDFWYGPAVLNLRPSVRVKRIENAHYKLMRIASPEMRWRENCVDVHYDVFIEGKVEKNIQHVQEDHLMRYYFESEISMLLEKNTFTTRALEEWLLGHQPNENSWGVCLVADAGE